MLAAIHPPKLHRIEIMKLAHTLTFTSAFALFAGPALADLNWNLLRMFYMIAKDFTQGPV